MGTQAERTISRKKCVYTVLLSLTISTSKAFVGNSQNSLRQKPKVPTQLFSIKEATFGMGCFWAPSESFLKVNGVIDTISGYTGDPNAISPPSYDNVCYGRQWVEAVRVQYDDEIISYAELLDKFFELQVPKVGSRQYDSIVFVDSSDQERAVKTWKANNALRRSDGLTPAATSVERATKFFKAENYHQRFWQKQRPRIAAYVALLAVAGGALDPYTPEAYQSSVATAANAAVLLGLGWLVIERKVDTKVVEL